MSAEAFNKNNAIRAHDRRVESFRRQAIQSGDTIEFYQCPVHRCPCRVEPQEFIFAKEVGECPVHGIPWTQFGPVMAKRPYQKKVRESSENSSADAPR